MAKNLRDLTNDIEKFLQGAGQSIGQTAQNVYRKYINPAANQAVKIAQPAVNFVNNAPAAVGQFGSKNLVVPTLTSTYKSAKPILDYLDPRGYSQNDTGKLVNAAKAMPMTALNLYGLSRMKPGFTIASGLIGGGLNAATGQDFGQGWRRGLEAAPVLNAIGSFTNPLIQRGANAAAAKFVSPIAQQAAARVTSGIANIPEGYLMRKGMGQNYKISDVPFDIAAGMVFGGPTSMKIKAADDAMDVAKKSLTAGGDSRPWHQAALEQAFNKKDYKKVGEILDQIPEDDPYKFNMERIMRRYVPADIDETKSLFDFSAYKQKGVGEAVQEQIDKAMPEFKGITDDYKWSVQKVAVDDLGESVAAGDPALVQQYTDAMKSGQKLPPPVAIRIDGKLQVLDGSHRTEGAIAATGKRFVDMVVGEPILNKAQNTSQFGQVAKMGFVDGNQPPPANPLMKQANDMVQDTGDAGQPPGKPPADLATPTDAGKPEDIGTWKERIGNKIDDIYTQAVDRFHPIEKFAKMGGTKSDQAMRNALTEYYGSTSTSQYNLEFKLKPILQSVDPNDLRQAGIAMRDVELAERGIQGSNVKDIGAAIIKAQEGGDEQLASALSRLQEMQDRLGPEKMKAVGDSLKDLYKYQDDLVQEYLVDSGVMSPKSYAAMKSKNQYYVPFKRVMDEVDDMLGTYPTSKGAGSVGSQNVIKSIKGSERDIVDPFESIVENTYKIVALGRRNQVAKEIVNIGDELPGMVEPYKGEIGNKPVISVFENGKVQKYLVPPDVAEAAKGLQEETMASVIKILSLPTQLVRATATAYNPEFQAPNVVRDVQSAYVNQGMNPLKFVQGLGHLLKKDDVYQEFLESGGRTSRVSLDRPQLTEYVDELTNPTGFSIKKPSDLIRIFQKMGDYSEQPTRIALFEDAKQKALESGLDEEEALKRAAYAAQEGTVNFARRGSKTVAVNALIAFFNARLQGTDRLLRTAKNDPAGFAFRMGLITQAPAVLTYLWNRNFKSFNDERVVPQFEKDNNFILMISDKPVDWLNGAQYVKLPKGDVGKFANPTEGFLAHLDGKGDASPFKQLSDAFIGLLPSNNLGDVLPSFIKPVVENKSNYSFFRNQDIVPNYKLDYPAGYQSIKQTPSIYKLIGRKTNISPLKIENFASGYTTGLEKLAVPPMNAVAEMIDPTLKEEAKVTGKDINRTPILRRFMGGERRTEEEQQLVEGGRASTVLRQIDSIQQAMDRKDLPYDVGQKQIDQLKEQYYKNPDNQKPYWQSITEAKFNLNPQERAAFQAIPDFDPADTAGKVYKYRTLLQYPAVYNAKREAAIGQAQGDMSLVDPLYIAPFSSAKWYLLYQAQNPGSQDKKDLYKLHPEIGQIGEARANFFKLHPTLDQNGQPQSSTGGAPIPSDYVSGQMDLKNWNDPQVQEYLNAKTAWDNQQREMMGLPPLQGFGFPKKKPTVKITKFKAPKITIKMGNLSGKPKKLKLPKAPKSMKLKVRKNTTQPKVKSLFTIKA